MRYATGDIIDVVQDCHYSERSYYVKGHCAPVVAQFLIERAYGRGEVPSYPLPEPIFGRWEMCWWDDEPVQGLAEHENSGRGKFPMMALRAEGEK